MSRRVSRTFGGNGGNNTFSLKEVNKIGFRIGDFVDQIEINDRKYGGGGGRSTREITLEPGEYINRFSIRSGQYIDYLRLWTNMGERLGGGGSGGNRRDFRNIRLTGIGGKYGWWINQLEIEYIEDYQPSRVVSADQDFIVEFIPPFHQVEVHTSTSMQLLEAFEKTISHSSEQNFGAKFEIDLSDAVKLIPNLGLNFKQSTTEKIKNEIILKLENSVTTRAEIPEGHVGLGLISADIMETGDGEIWIKPNSGIVKAAIPFDEYRSLLNYYDLTGQLHIQIPELRNYISNSHGLVQYRERFVLPSNVFTNLARLSIPNRPERIVSNLGRRIIND